MPDYTFPIETLTGWSYDFGQNTIAITPKIPMKA